MKVSLIVPSLNELLLKQFLKSLTNTTLDGLELETVVISPFDASKLSTVWVPDNELKGNNPANRMGFQGSSGDTVIFMAEELTVSNPKWLANNLACLAGQLNVVVDTMNAGVCCFDKLYATVPLCLRSTVKDHYQYCYPYTAHWGDPAFSLDVWRSNGRVIPGNSGLTWRERLGCPESPLKASAFGADYLSFLKDFADLAVGFNCSSWPNINRHYTQPAVRL